MLNYSVMFLTGEWAIAGEVQEGGRLGNPLTAAGPPPRNSLRRGFRPDEGGVAEARGDLPSLRGRPEARPVVRLVMFRDVGTAGLPDIDPVRRHDLKLIDDFISRVAH